jgi:hypothetical protein
MTPKVDLQSVLDKIFVEQLQAEIEIPPVQASSSKQQDDLSAAANSFEFRPLTEEEKQAFVSSIDANGKQLLSEPADNSKNSRDRAA